MFRLLLISMIIFGSAICYAAPPASDSEAESASRKDSVVTPPPPSLARKAASRYLHFSGSAGAFGELYNTTAEYQRRPSSTARSYVNATLTAWKFQIPVELVISSEEVTYRQQFNRLGITPQWRWIRLYMGDFAGSLSQYTVSGISIRGGGIALTPDWFRFVFLYGRTQRAVDDPRANNYVYKRILTGIKAGIGKETATYFNVSFVKAKDDETSIAIPSDSSGVRPQENMVIGAESRLVLFQKKLQIKGEGAFSLHSLNVNAEKGSGKNVPGWIKSLFPVRLSTRGDYAFNTDVSYRHQIVSGRFNFERIGPGYVSLGLPYTMNDRQKTGGAINYNAIPRKLSLRGNFSYRTDNLENQKVKTMKHTVLSLGANGRPGRGWGFNIMYNKNTLKNETNLDSLIYWENNEQKKRQLFDTYNDRYTLGASYNSKIKGLANSVSASYALQKSEKKFESEDQNGFDVQNVNLSDQLSIKPWLNVGLSASFSSSKVGEKSVNSQVFAFTTGYTPYRRWRNNLSVSLQKSGEQKAVNYVWNMRIGITPKDQINMKMMKLDFFDPVNPEREYKEHRASLTYNRSF